MRHALKSALIGYLIPAWLVLATLAVLPPPSVEAGLIPSHALSSMRQNEMERLRPVLESKIVRQRLADFGLTPEETATRMAALSDADIHQIARHLDALQPGGSVLGTVAVLLVIALLVVLLLHLTGHKVIITK